MEIFAIIIMLPYQPVSRNNSEMRDIRKEKYLWLKHLYFLEKQH